MKQVRLANWRSYSRTEHFLAKICDFSRPFRATFSKRPKSAIFVVKNAPFSCGNTNLPNRTCFTRLQGEGVYFEDPTAGISYPTPLYLIHPPPLEGYFQGWGVGGV